MPSLWLYLKIYWDLNSATHFYGITAAAFNLAVLLVTPLTGYAAYRGVRGKVILIVSDQLEILGNIMYWIGQSPWVVLCGRFISGTGASCEPSLYADLVKLTSEEERTSYIIAMLMPRQLGLLFGPAFTILVHTVNANVGQFSFSVYNMPGIMMAGLWLLHSLLVFTFYPNVSKDSNPTNVPTCSCLRRCACCSPCDAYQDEDKHAVQEDNPAEDGKITIVEWNTSNLSATDLRFYSNYPIVVLFIIAFSLYFNVLCVEAVLSPTVEQLFAWHEVEASYVYMGGGIVVLITFLLVRISSKKFSDRTFITVGLVLLLLSYFWLTCFLSFTPKPVQGISISLFITGLFFHTVGMPIALVGCESLYTKITPESDSDRAQAILRTLVNVGYFTGPFVGGSMASVPYAATLLMMLLIFISLVLLCAAYDLFAQTH
ncbi:unnamed protein product [Calicophoron daubneyi]|uniref:Major facilitator superfamily (MFS) profile domain-containing protein n=1 Tax=Calicophoron daubneyi TaxID=300641 RepID=A0AAV2TQC9_CALDB